MPIRVAEPATDPAALGLRALVWTLGDERRAAWLLDVTGLTPATLRDGAGEPSTLAALLGFIETNEADLLACAKDLGVAPEALVRAREALER